MKKLISIVVLFLFSQLAYSQAGHIMQGIGASSMSMGGAGTGLSLDISSAMHWNPAALTNFNGNHAKLDLGLFFSSPEVFATLPPEMLGPGAPSVTGITEDSRGASMMPALAYSWRKLDSKHAFGVSAFGISGFGVTFEEEANNPLSASFNPTINSNPINYPQAAMGFGRVESNYMLMQVSFTWAYQVSDMLSIAVQPNFNYAGLELMPNPTANPNQAGYPSAEQASALGFGAQVSALFKPIENVSLGASYKSEQTFGDFELENSHLDGQTATNNFNMSYPSILSVGVGITGSLIDVALDYRNVNYENADGFQEAGWTQTASVNGFAWQNIDIVSAGIQFKGIEDIPLRIGYTYSSNPINSEYAFFSIPATAVIKNAFQFGGSFNLNEKIKVDAVYHYGTSSGDTVGSILNPAMISPTNPLGAILGSEVGYNMTTSMFMLGFNYHVSQ